MLITNVRSWGGDAVDLEISGGRISAVHAAGTGAVTDDADGQKLDGRGRIALPAFTDVHVHLDSTRIGLPFRGHTGSPGVWNMMRNDRENWRGTPIPYPDVVAGTLERMIARGTTRVRSYAQIDVDCKLERFEAVMAAKERFARAADVEIMAFPQAGILLEEGTVPLLEEALRAGATTIGGIDPCQLDRDPVRHLDIVFGLAEKYGVDVDIHLHEPGQLGVFSAELVFERTRALAMQGRVSLSHAYDLANVHPDVTARIMEQMAELDVAWATVAPASGGTQFDLAQMTAAGIRVGLGEDGQRDYWSPYGNCDMLDRTWQLAFTHRLRKDRLIEHCAAIATVGGASIVDRTVQRLTSTDDRPGLTVGDAANIVMVEGETVTSAVMDRGTDRTVTHNGRLVADGLVVLPELTA
ncbi:cytosine/adenosine deaminase-related metal-dependent hydrolase [Arthrobacter sp. SLBN-100]|uniref:amidohydrolase family protein n=1 Tax=Arthrobacter sp. SLBN-100 TaxID=2768450 RepID=UPI001153275B|nr:amidohydrolase family protein [Arthrobacter sp. SLBN-100]TQJ68109.1 cytosine/adenosine deaminase-related metal-dependent hydrolase [Arthrobacter sp. SLBN-100]